MPSVSNVGQAIKIAKAIITEAGYYVAQITSVELDEENQNWVVNAQTGTIDIYIEIDADTGEVVDFSTEE